MEHSPEDELREEYDLAALPKGVRGKYKNRHTADHKKPDETYEKTASFPDFLATEQLTANTQSFLKHIDRELQPILQRSVLPIYCYKGAQVGICGTGTLFRIGLKSFLVTASHVVADSQKLGYGLGVTDCIANGSMVALHGTIHGNHLDEMDFAIWDLPKDVVTQLPSRSFLSIHQTMRDTRVGTNATYMIHGYPSEFGKFEPSTPSGIIASVIPFTVFTGCYQGSTDLLLDYNPGHHLLLETTKGEGEHIRNHHIAPPTKVNGMSGCAVWQVYYEGFRARHWTTNDAVVAGIQTGVYNNGNVTKVTKWHLIYQLLVQKFPELQGPLSLVVA